MPGSSELFDKEILEFLKQHIGSVMDIGPGSGKMGKLAREAGCSPVECVETFTPYVWKYKLPEIYDSIVLGSATSLINSVDKLYDIVIFGDSIEHMVKSDGRDLIEFLVIRSKWILVKYPTNTESSSLFQGTCEGNPQEGHISIWSERDFDGLYTEHFTNGAMKLAIIRGFRK